ncbi:hypothetical protein CR532_02940 [Candidatus Borreliella tachyglossi]|uniref:DUF3996 domain-containing protein n=1 Tax=Candidatus Borreliella tachyglossi TaxID=1964448 RepID=A0A2S1LXA9_9SPIR|nr:DUF3996 domain-containing protein [Candidatus Borreliella tachyglossi]AWG42928.1 hypothetical protein CR532_02940 [Candidatus Borreliella tachyglossi]
MQKLILIMALLLIIWTSAFARSSYLNRGVGFGGSIGNPIFNYIVSFPFIDLEIGYGGTNGINLSGLKIKSKKYDFNVFLLAALDLIFTIPVIERLSIGMGIGGSIHMSSHKSDLINMQIGFGLRMPITMFYDLTEKVEIGFKIAPSIEFVSNSRSLVYHHLYAGFKTNIVGGIFAKYYI